MTPSKVLQALLGIIVAAGFFVVMYGVMTKVVPTENREVFLMLISQLSGAFLAVIGYAFGSSAGSARKDEALFSTPKDRP